MRRMRERRYCAEKITADNGKKVQNSEVKSEWKSVK